MIPRRLCSGYRRVLSDAVEQVYGDHFLPDQTRCRQCTEILSHAHEAARELLTRP